MSGIVTMPRPPATVQTAVQTAVQGAPTGPEERRMETIHGALGLAGDPFPAVPDATPGAIWIDIPSRGSVLHELTSWLTDPEFPGLTDQGLAVVTGEAGSGRTSLLMALAGSLADRSDLHVAIVPDEGNRRSDALLLRAMIAALGAAPTGRTGRELIAELRALLTTHLAAGQRPVILIDNAALTGSQLEIVRMLLVPTSDDASIPEARLVLFGPLELNDRIRRRHALAAMVEMTHPLAPVDEDEVAAILDGCIDAMLPEARRRGDGGPLFTADAIAIIGGWSGGNLAEVVRCAGACLREAIARGRSDVDRAIAYLVVRELTEDAATAPAGETVEPVIQTKLDLGFTDEGPGPVVSGRSTRHRRRR